MDSSVDRVYAVFTGPQCPSQVASFLYDALGPWFDMRVRPEGIYIKVGSEREPSEPEVCLKKPGYLVLDAESGRIMTLSSTVMRNLYQEMRSTAEKVLDSFEEKTKSHEGE